MELKAKSKDHLFTVLLDRDELACRILEAMFKKQRPPNTTATEALSVLDEEDIRDMRRAAIVAFDYIAECIDKSNEAQVKH